MVADAMAMKMARAAAVAMDAYRLARPLSGRGSPVRTTGMSNGKTTVGPTVSSRVEVVTCAGPSLVTATPLYKGTSRSASPTAIVSEKAMAWRTLFGSHLLLIGPPVE
jgi:hypothetical protein